MWSLTRAAREFSTAKTSLGAKLKAAGENADESGLFSTAQLTRVIYGSIFAERARLLREQGDKVHLENQILRREFLPAKELRSVFEETAREMTRIIRSSPFDRQTQDDVLLQLSALRVELWA
jgi:phage terminase Nu1 subunit (DNA packaging protein)